jgi:hypothetical protein
VSVVPTRRLALVVLALGVVLAVAPVPLPSVWAVAGILAAVAVLLAVGDALAAVRPGALTLERHHPPVVVAGTTATLEWVVRSDATRSVRLLVADELAPSLRAAARRFDVRVPAGDVVRVSTPFQPMRRRARVHPVPAHATGSIRAGPRGDPHRRTPRSRVPTA